MFSSFFGSLSADQNGGKATFHPVTSAFKPDEFFGPLTPKDTEWACEGGFVTETQTFYHTFEDGIYLMCQVIHSAVGLWYPTIQFTCKLYKPDTNEQIWKSVNVSNFTTPPVVSSGKQYDKRSCKSDQFSIIHNVSGDVETYTITANPADDLQIYLVITRETAGYKFGNGAKGGFSYFGSDTVKPEGYVVHRFWPRTKASGHVIHKGRAITAEGHGMFVHAIQGMRPNLVAASWNFCDFQSDELGGVSAIQMEYTTIDAYGREGYGSGGVIVNLGSLVIGGKLIAVSGETRWPDEKDASPEFVSRVEHLDPIHDPETGYEQPQQIKFSWTAPVIEGDGENVSATLLLEVGSPANPKGLLQKVDVLAEIPYVIKKLVNYVAGTKPYIYQWLNPAKLRIKGPGGVVPGFEVDVQGTLFNEATFIS